MMKIILLYNAYTSRIWNNFTATNKPAYTLIDSNFPPAADLLGV